MKVNELAQITISDRGDEICELLKELKYFGDKKDAYIYAICLAMALDLPLDPKITTPNNRWHATAIFHAPGRDLASVMALMGYDEEEIISKGKMLAEAGLRYIDEKRLSQADLVDVLLNTRAQ
jgi:hypothetical protein